MQRRKFSREFKVEAVRLIKEQGVSAAQAARDLDVHENVLRKWVRELASDPSQAQTAASSSRFSPAMSKFTCPCALAMNFSYWFSANRQAASKTARASFEVSIFPNLPANTSSAIEDTVTARRLARAASDVLRLIVNAFTA